MIFINGRLFPTLTAALLGLLVASPTAKAGGTDIIPPFVTLTEAQPMGTLTILNDRGVSAGYDVEAFGWEQEPDGKVLLLPTSGIRLKPTKVNIPAHGNVRIQVTAQIPAPPPGSPENVYRIRISEHSDREREETEKVVQTISSFTIPVFQKPDKTAYKGRLSLGAIANGVLDFAVHNDGTEHTYVGQAIVHGQDETGREIFRIQRQGWYVLPNGRLEFKASLASEDCRKSSLITIEAHVLESSDAWMASLTPDATQCGDSKVSEFPIPGMKKIVNGEVPNSAPTLAPPEK